MAAETKEVALDEALIERCPEGRVRAAMVEVVYLKMKGMRTIYEAIQEDADPATYLSRLLEGMIAPKDVEGHAEVGKLVGAWHAAVEFRPLLSDEETREIAKLTGNLAAAAAESAWKDGFVAGLIYARSRRREKVPGHDR